MSHHDEHRDEEKHDDERQEGEPQDEERQEGGRQITEAPEITDEHKEKAAEMRKSYDDTRPTAVMPGTDRTITGTAVAEWIDDEGNPKFGDPDESPHAEDKSKDDKQSEDQPRGDESQEASENA